MKQSYRLMCDHCGESMRVYPGEYFFVRDDVVIHCCRKPVRLESWDGALPPQWQPVQTGITPRQFHELTKDEEL